MKHQERKKGPASEAKPSSPQRKTSKKESRFERPKEPAKIIVQPRDKQILGLVYEHRFMTREQIQKLFFHSTTRANIRLRLLFDNQYLDRHFLYPLLYHGSFQTIYSLGKQGVEIVVEQLGLDKTQVQQSRKETETLKPFSIHHILAVNDFRIMLQLETDNNPEVEFKRWIPEKELLDRYETRVDSRKVIRRFRPDGYGRYLYQQKLYSFFLEIDRATQSNNSFQNKVRAYLDYSRSGRYSKVFGVKFFRVLVVTTTDKRLTNLKNATEEIASQFFWFTTLDQIKQGNIFESVWQIAGGNGIYSLLGGFNENLH